MGLPNFPQTTGKTELASVHGLPIVCLWSLPRAVYFSKVVELNEVGNLIGLRNTLVIEHKLPFL